MENFENISTEKEKISNTMHFAVDLINNKLAAISITIQVLAKSHEELNPLKQEMFTIIKNATLPTEKYLGNNFINQPINNAIEDLRNKQNNINEFVDFINNHLSEIEKLAPQKITALNSLISELTGGIEKTMTMLQE